MTDVDWLTDRHHRARGQLVLVAAIALAIALVPAVLAYMQLGYHEDIRAGSDANTEEQVERTLAHSIQNASAGMAGTYAWAERAGAISTLNDRLAPTLRTVNRSGLDAGTVTQVTYNETLASQWATGNCPNGPNRQFGPCEADGGVIVQERAGSTHVLGAAFDVWISTPEADVQLTTVLESG